MVPEMAHPPAYFPMPKWLRRALSHGLRCADREFQIPFGFCFSELNTLADPTATTGHQSPFVQRSSAISPPERQLAPSASQLRSVSRTVHQ